ncbi:hypothetical protein Bbelb_210530 [Branchiostoma belcheri]|nr:hypothetical protein Bbelb_210530 [Branchiostoma belcheri]
MTMSVQTETSTFEPSCPTSCNVTSWARRNCTAENVRGKFPITLWLPRYQCSWVQSDFIAGLTVALTVIPQGLAYAHLAELPLQYGLYSSFMGCLVYFFLGSSKDITLGPTAIMSLMVASYAEGDTTYAVALTLLCGCIQLGMGIFRLGFLVNFISFPVINGFTSAAAITIAFGQVKHVLGLHNIPRDFFPCVYYTFKNLGKTNLWDLLMGAVCFVLLLLLKWLKDVKWDSPDEVGYSPTRWQQAGRKVVWLIGTARNAVVVVSAALVVVALKSQDIDVLTLTEQVQPGLPAFKPPTFTVHHGNTTETAGDILQGLGAGLAVVPLIGFLECIAIGKAFVSTLTVTRQSRALHFLSICILLLAGDICPNPGPPQNLTVATSNVRSLNPNTDHGSAKLSELELYLNNENISILGLTETWFNDSIKDSDISIPGYSTLLRKDRKGQVGGGVALLICDLLPCKRRPDLESNNSSWQDLWAEIWVNGNKILVACIYRPPTAPDTFFQDFEHNVAKAVDEKGQIIITGDFNCHNSAWGGTLTDNNGLLLADIVDRYGLYQSQYLETRITQTCKSEAWNNYTTYKNRLTSELRKAEREFYHTISDKCKSPDASKLLWSVLNRLNGKESRGIPTLSNNGLLVDKEEEKAELLNEIFVNITKDCNHPDRTMKLPILTSKQFTTLQVTREEVLTVLLSLQVDKAPGPDGISNKLLREAAPEICDSLQCLFNYSLSTGTFPTEWKQSNVTPVYKKGDKTDPLNYRPISLLPTVAKVMERLVHNHLYSYLEENNLLHNNQSGFRKGDGTVLQLIRMVNDWARSIDDPDISCTAVVFLDVRRAFDTVWHQGLTYKLTRYGVGGPLLHWFDSYLTGRQQRVVINGITSSWGKTAAGVPQGSILGPLLFLVYLNDLMSLPCRSALNCFADDTSLYNSAKTSQEVAVSINADLQLVSTWFSDWGLTLHPDKCKVVCVKSGRKNALLPPIYLHGKLVEQVSSYSHLGVTIHQTLTWTEHVQVTTSKSRKVLGVLRKVMGKLGRQALETAYFALVRPKLEYAAALLGDLNNTASKMLEQVQYHACCLVTGAMKGTPYSNLLQELEWDTLSSRRQYNSLTIMYRMTKGLVPPHLQSLTPPTRGSQFTRIQLRNNTHLCVPRCRTQVYKTSFIPHTSSLWNQLPQTVRDASNLAAFKRASKKHLLTTRHHQMYRTLGSRPNNIRTTRLRVGWCQLNSTLYKMKIKGKACVCGSSSETVQHYLLHCPLYSDHRSRLTAAVERLVQQRPTVSLLLQGMGNIVSSFVSSYPITGSFSRTAVNSHSGVKTPAGGLVTAAVVLLALGVLTPSFHYIPQAALAAVIISAVLTMVDFMVLVKLWRLQKLDLLPLVCTFFGTFIGIEWGILAGVGVSAMILLFPQARPGLLVDNKDVLIFQPDRGLHYPGVDFIRTLLYDRALKEKPYRPVVLDCSHIASIDYTTIQGLKEVLEEFNRMRVPLTFAALKPHLQEVLTAADLPGFRCYATANEAANCIYEDGDPETNPYTPLLNAVQH